MHNISRGLYVPGPDPTVQRSTATVMIHNAPMDLRGWAAFYRAGCHAVTAMSRMPPSQAIDARVKNRSRMSYTLAEMEVKLVDKDAQGVILDIHGNVGENKGGNLFAVSEGELLTPTTENCLAGISRETVLELAKELKIPARETALQPYDLYTADELFFTSTPYCIMPATRFNGVPVGDGEVGGVTSWLLDAWERAGGGRHSEAGGGTDGVRLSQRPRVETARFCQDKGRSAALRRKASGASRTDRSGGGPERLPSPAAATNEYTAEYE